MRGQVSVDKKWLQEWIEQKRKGNYLDADFYNQYFIALADSIEKSDLKPKVKERLMDASLSVLLGIKIGPKVTLERPSPRGGNWQFATTANEFETRLVSVASAVLEESNPRVVEASEKDAVDREMLSIHADAMKAAYELSGIKPAWGGSVSLYQRPSDGSRSR